MKDHKRQEYQQLKDVNALSIQESMLHTMDIVNELKHQQEDLLQSAEKRFKSGLAEVVNLAITDMEGKEKDSQETRSSGKKKVEGKN